MADFKEFFSQLVQEEGSYVDNPADKGGPTKYGVTLEDWVRGGYDKNSDGVIDKEDVKAITQTDAYNIAKKNYWDRIQADSIVNQSVANLIFDWSYLSGAGTAIKHVQKILNITADGIIGPKTIDAINNANQAYLFAKLKSDREAFFEQIVANDPSQSVFLRGWQSRNNRIKFSN